MQHRRDQYVQRHRWRTAFWRFSCFKPRHHGDHGMSIWFVHRPNGLGTPISWAGQYVQPGYADEQLDDATSAELQAFLAPARNPPKPRPTPRQWLERLSPATQLALETAALTNAQISL